MPRPYKTTRPKSQKYNRQQWFDDMCDYITTGKSLTSFVANHPDGPRVSTFLQWMDDKKLHAQYMRARQLRAQARADRIDQIIEDTLAKKLDPNAARVAIDALKWQAGKEDKLYSDTQRIDHSSSDGTMAPRNDGAAVVSGILSDPGKKRKKEDENSDYVQ